MECKHFEIAYNLIRPHRKFNADILYMYTNILSFEKMNRTKWKLFDLCEWSRRNDNHRWRWIPSDSQQSATLDKASNDIHTVALTWFAKSLGFSFSTTSTFKLFVLLLREYKRGWVWGTSAFLLSCFYSQSVYFFFSLSSKNLFNIKSDTFLNHPFLWVFFFVGVCRFVKEEKVFVCAI